MLKFVINLLKKSYIIYLINIYFGISNISIIIYFSRNNLYNFIIFILLAFVFQNYWIIYKI